jgi:hypothetical protein
MSNPSRREFVTLCSGAVLSLATGLRPVSHRAGSCHAPVRVVVHPEPRAGITAARVLPNDRLTEHPDAISAFEQVRQVPQIVDGIGCHCGCATRKGFYSLLSCYEGEGMAMMCEVCQGQGRLAFRLHQGGKTLNEIRAAIDARYG